MSFNQNFPFNFKPTTTSVFSGNFTVPSNEYAFVTASCRGQESLGIDGTTVLESNNTGSWVTLSGIGSTYDVPDGFYVAKAAAVSGSSIAFVDVQPSGGGIVLGTIDEFSVSNGGLSNAVIDLGAGLKARLVGNNANTNTRLLVLPLPGTSNTVTASYWVGPGTVLTGNAEKVVSRFLIP